MRNSKGICCKPYERHWLLETLDRLISPTNWNTCLDAFMSSLNWCRGVDRAISPTNWTRCYESLEKQWHESSRSLLGWTNSFQIHRISQWSLLPVSRAKPTRASSIYRQSLRNQGLMYSSAGSLWTTWLTIASSRVYLRTSNLDVPEATECIGHPATDGCWRSTHSVNHGHSLWWSFALEA